MSRSSTVKILILILGFVGCKTKHEDHTSYKSGSFSKTSRDFLIPRELRSEIEKLYLEFIRKENPKVVLSDEEVLSRIPREFLDLEIYFRADSPGVLSDQIKLALPRGGGEVDLKDYVKGTKGSFFMKFKVKRSKEPDVDVAEPPIFYLSEAKTRKIAGEAFGSGCKKYMDVTKTLNKANQGEGFHLNATDQRYASVIGGTFYFVDFNPERKIYLAAVRFVDSRYPELFCE